MKRPAPFRMMITATQHLHVHLPLAFMIVIFSTCNTSVKRESGTEKMPKQDELIQHQRSVVRNEDEDIENYITRRNYSMITTQTGLRYYVYYRGSGNILIREDDVVEIDYEVSLLNGTVVYSSKDQGQLELKVGKSNLANGLQEGLRYLHQGDKALLIIPSHLAYGLTGDGDKIGKFQVLVMNVEVLRVN